VEAHRFKVGQNVSYTPAGPPFSRGNGGYKVTRLMPPEDAEFRYRIKSVDEPHERVVKESELERSV
jgi:hypothetical protein